MSSKCILNKPRSWKIAKLSIWRWEPTKPNGPDQSLEFNPWIIIRRCLDFSELMYKFGTALKRSRITACLHLSCRKSLYRSHLSVITCLTGLNPIFMSISPTTPYFHHAAIKTKDWKYWMISAYILHCCFTYQICNSHHDWGRFRFKLNLIWCTFSNSSYLTVY